MSGAGFFLLGAPHLLQRFLPQTTLAQQGISWLALGLAAIVLAINAIWGRRFIASRTDSPQQGQMQSKRSNWLLLPMVLVSLLLVPLVLVYGFTSYGRHPDSYMLDQNRLASPAFALMFAALSLHYAWKRRASVLLAYAIYLACLALLIWWLPLNPTERHGLLMSGAGGPLPPLERCACGRS
jgi:hypothetical protein